jgi:hypothetical protein
MEPEHTRLIKYGRFFWLSVFLPSNSFPIWRYCVLTFILTMGEAGIFLERGRVEGRRKGYVEREEGGNQIKRG